MLLTLFCSFATGLVVYCILKRVHAKNLEIAVGVAVREVEKEYEGRQETMATQLIAREDELAKARSLVKQHQAAMPGASRPGRALAAKPSIAPPVARPTGAPPTKLPEPPVNQPPLQVFEMSGPFTESSFDALLATSDVVQVEPARG